MWEVEGIYELWTFLWDHTLFMRSILVDWGAQVQQQKRSLGIYSSILLVSWYSCTKVQLYWTQVWSLKLTNDPEFEYFDKEMHCQQSFPVYKVCWLVQFRPRSSLETKHSCWSVAGYSLVKSQQFALRGTNRHRPPCCLPFKQQIRLLWNSDREDQNESRWSRLAEKRTKSRACLGMQRSWMKCQHSELNCIILLPSQPKWHIVQVPCNRISNLIYSEHVAVRCQTPGAAKNKQEAVLKATTVRSPLPVMSLILPCPPCLLHRGGGPSGGRGVWQGEVGLVGGGGGGRGHFIHLAIYCTATWFFALKGLRTTRHQGEAVRT